MINLRYFRDKRERETQKALADDHTLTGDLIQELLKLNKDKLDERSFMELVLLDLNSVDKSRVKELEYKRLSVALYKIGCHPRSEWLDLEGHEEERETWEERNFKHDLKNGELIAGEELINTFFEGNKKSIEKIKDERYMEKWLKVSRTLPRTVREEKDKKHKKDRKHRHEREEEEPNLLDY